MPFRLKLQGSFWRDERLWRWVWQLLVLLVVGLGAIWLVDNLVYNLSQRGLSLSFDWLDQSAGFNIGESAIAYRTADSYARALVVGLVNSLRVIAIGLILTTVIGTLAGVAAFSENWLLRQLSRGYVAVVRNTPLLLQLIVWYFPILLSLPAAQQPWHWLGSLYLSKQGIYLPWPQTPGWLVVILAIALVLFVSWLAQRQRSQRDWRWLYGAIAVVTVLMLLTQLSWPQQLQPGQIRGGLRLSLEFTALLLGLVAYTGAFITEIIRGGILSVPAGQWEAAAALGLTRSQTLWQIVVPQALRVIVPSLNSQYVGFAKNSSLAIAVGYPDLYATAQTTLNQTGRPVEVFLILMLTYLAINAVISASMNGLQQRLQRWGVR
ncbi:amino acid ABC transporter permease [Synechococcus elongatus]|uniref:amino acid ABC transporter permease n=1 Tax=Synechococcus elongatus TaxID=32046 RepID=UPI000F7DF47E|nr:ABC transporter permease subunit [Synechococcus elongatus]